MLDTKKRRKSIGTKGVCYKDDRGGVRLSGKRLKNKTHHHHHLEENTQESDVSVRETTLGGKQLSERPHANRVGKGKKYVQIVAYNKREKEVSRFPSSSIQRTGTSKTPGEQKKLRSITTVRINKLSC